MSVAFLENVVGINILGSDDNYRCTT